MGGFVEIGVLFVRHPFSACYMLLFPVNWKLKWNLDDWYNVDVPIVSKALEGELVGT